MKRLAKHTLLRVVQEACAALDLRARVRASVGRAPRSANVLAIGKAAPAMALGALDAWSEAIEDVLVIAPEGVTMPDDARVHGLRGAHPLPDQRSLRAAERALAFARETTTTLLVLVSGGASALVCAPNAGVSLAQKRALTETMLRSGASIQELNVVRKHLSRIKGGGLLRVTDARVRTLIASDVIGGVASDIGSGPSVPDRTSVRDARRLLRRFAPRFGELPLARTFSARDGRTRIIASPEDLAGEVARRLRAFGAVRVLPPSTASANELAGEYLELARRLRPGSSVVRAAEPSVRVASDGGRGGRSAHLAALVGRALPHGVLFLAFASDGVDGVSGTGGALVSAGFAKRDAIEDALARFDTGPLHVGVKSALAEKPSGHNLADVHVLARV